MAGSRWVRSAENRYAEGVRDSILDFYEQPVDETQATSIVRSDSRKRLDRDHVNNYSTFRGQTALIHGHSLIGIQSFH
ncbi:MAG: hypothetical protein Aurels2KO_56070 [Aureliella sp.]